MVLKKILRAAIFALVVGLLMPHTPAFANGCTNSSPCTCTQYTEPSGLQCSKCTVTCNNSTTFEGQACGGSGPDGLNRREIGACNNARRAGGCTNCRDSEDASAAAAGSRACAIFNSQQLDSSSVLTEKQLQAALDCRNSLRRK